MIDRPEPTKEGPQNRCLDKTYDFPKVRELFEEYGYTAHIRSMGEATKDKKILGTGPESGSLKGPIPGRTGSGDC